MVDDLNLQKEKKWYYETRAKTVLKHLQKRQMDAQYVPGTKEALAAVMEMIPPGVTVSRGSSISVDQVGVMEEIKKRGQNPIINPIERDVNGRLIHDIPERQRLEREVFSSDIFISSTNAITLDGKLVSIDGHGNRVSAMIFGPNKVIFVVGANKIVKDLDEALARVRSVATPVNTMWHYLKHGHPEVVKDLPCMKTGFCVDCSHPERPCRYTVIIEGSDAREPGRINVVLVGEDLGI